MDTLREYLEATNHAEAFDTLPALVEHSITVETVQQLHRLLMDKIDPHAGELRKVQVYIRGAPFTPPPAPQFNTTVDYLGQLARAGKFEAKKRGQHWYASKEAVQQYFQEASEQPRGRPRKR